QVPPPPARTSEAADRGVDQRAHARGTHQIELRKCLKGLDIFRPDNPIMSRDALTEPLYSQGCDLGL
ncbi:MAG: hypothetical protein ACLQFX_08820, partial [Acidimicrobiales bacterium]